MKMLLSKSNFPKAPDGDRYEWKSAETIFNISKNGIYAIKIAATAKNAKQNRSTDDDDLRIALDGFSFGKYEIHDGKISWKGFGTSASWNGASLKSATKTIYFFVELDKGEHKIQFFADMTPKIEDLEVFRIQNNNFELTNLKPPKKIQSERKGIPWLSFIFLGSHTKSILLDVNTKSSKEKGTTDGDNLKVVVNGNILKNEKAPTSKKYKNFYFSGDMKSTGILSISNENLADPLAFENSLELWYDEEPEIAKLQISFFDNEAFLEELESLMDLRKSVLTAVDFSLIYFRGSGRIYSEKFLKHSLGKNPKTLEFRSNHPIVRKIKKDPEYGKIRKAINDMLNAGILEGELYPRNISFESFDLDYSIHGIKKIEYKTHKKRDSSCVVNFQLYDIYDFGKKDIPFSLSKAFQYFKQEIINTLDAGEGLGIISNFEIIINVKDIF